MVGAPNALQAGPAAHQSLIYRNLVAEVPLIGLSYDAPPKNLGR